MNTQVVEFLPGDRVRYIGSSIELKGLSGTIIPKPTDAASFQRDYVYFTFDNDPIGVKWRTWPEIELTMYIERIPVTVGKFVRLHQTMEKRGFNDFTYLGEINHIIHYHHPTPIAVINGAGYPLDDLVTVAENPATAGFRIEVHADGSVTNTINAENFSIRTGGVITSVANQAIEEAADIIKPNGIWSQEIATTWLTKYAPHKLPKPPVFKRGDLVDVDRGNTMVHATGRIISRDHDRPIVEVVTKFGDFIMTDVDHIKHSANGH